MAIESRKASSLLMKLVVKKVKKKFSAIPSDIKLDDIDWKSIRQKQREEGLRLRSGHGAAAKRKEFCGVPAEVFVPQNYRFDNIVLFLHGGAFLFGIGPHYRKYASTMASHLCCPVVMPDYALAPEHPFPAGLDDCEKVYLGLKKSYPDSRIIVIGDSAGGGLCVSLCLRLKKKGLALPEKMVLHSPVVDLSGQFDRSVNDDINTDFIIRKGLGGTLEWLYIGEADPTDPELSPYFGSLEGFPPTFQTCEKHETLYADALWIDSQLEKAGVPVRTIEMDGAFHTVGAIGDITPETRRITREIVRFILVG